jgi:hypothetical protein
LNHQHKEIEPGGEKVMKLDHQYIERSEALERDSRAGISLYGYVGHQEMPEGDDFGDFLKGQGIPYTERRVDAVGTWEDTARELHYRPEEQGERYAYVLTFRADIDAWGQSVYIFAQPVPDDRLGSTILMIRQQERDLDRLIYERRCQLDEEYPPYWRLINYNWQMSTIAYHLTTRGWTPHVEQLLGQWGAYQTAEGIGLDNPLVQSLLAYGELIKRLDDPDRYLRDLLENAGAAGRHYRQLL